MNKTVQKHANRLGVDAEELFAFYRGLAPFPKKADRFWFEEEDNDKKECPVDYCNAVIKDVDGHLSRMHDDEDFRKDVTEVLDDVAGTVSDDDVSTEASEE